MICILPNELRSEGKNIITVLLYNTTSGSGVGRILKELQFLAKEV